MNVLAPGELLVAIRIPATMAGAQFYFEKVRDRQVWDFPLVNVASAIKPNGGTIGDDAPRRQRGGGDAEAAEAGRGGRRRQAAQRRDGEDGRRSRRPGRGRR